VAHLSPQALSRLRRTSKTIHKALCPHEQAQLWTCAAAATGLSGIRGMAEVSQFYRAWPVFCCSCTFGARIEQGRRLVLDLGSSHPVTRRVAAASSVVSMHSSSKEAVAFDIAVKQLDNDATHHHVVLWLGVLHNKRDGAALSHLTVHDALSAYDVSKHGQGMTERFSSGDWTLSAIGSNGAVWADGTVRRLLGPAFRFGAGDVVRLIIDYARRELRVRVNGGTEAVAVRRLVSRVHGGSEAEPPRLHAIAHLTDVAHPILDRHPRAILEVGKFC
jgi:hypothetical protein